MMTRSAATGTPRTTATTTSGGVGLAVTKEGIPVRCWSFPERNRPACHPPGARRVGRLQAAPGAVDRRGRLCLRATAPTCNGPADISLGEKRVKETPATRPSPPGRYQATADNLEVKEVIVGSGSTRRRFVVCKNSAEAQRDRLKREQALARMEAELISIEKKKGDARLAAEGELLAHPMLRRYLTRRGGRLVIDKAKVKAEYIWTASSCCPPRTIASRPPTWLASISHCSRSKPRGEI